MQSRELFTAGRTALAVGADETGHTLSDVYLPVQVPTAEPDVPLEMRLNVVNVGRVTAGFMSFNRPATLLCGEAVDFHVDIPLRGRALMNAGRSECIHASMHTGALFMPGRPVRLDFEAGFAQIALMVSRAALQLELESLLGRHAGRPLEFDPEMDLATRAAATVTQTIDLIDQASAAETGLLDHPLAVQNLERVFMGSLLLGQPHNYSEALRTGAPQAGPRPVRRAADLLRDRPEHSWSVGELAAEVSVSVRSLQESFRRSLDTTPTAFLRDVRLQRVHAELMEADAAADTVAAIAAQWGFTHLGRFAGEYRKRFGERPFDTLRSRNERHAR